MPLSLTIDGPTRAQLDAFERACREQLERAALGASHAAGRKAAGDLRAAMSAARLGRLGRAIGTSSDLEKGRPVHRRPDGFSASGAVYVRGRSERTRGAIEAYTEGAEIRPRRSPWLWVPSPDLQRRVKGGTRLSPALWASSGLEARIGPLVQIRGRHAQEALLIVPAVTVRVSGKASPRRLPKRGGIRAGRELRENFIAFVGIRRTSRKARIDPHAIIREAQAEMPAFLAKELSK